MIPYFFKKILAGDINSLNLLVSNVLSPSDIVSRPDNMDETELHTSWFYHDVYVHDDVLMTFGSHYTSQI